MMERDGWMEIKLFDLTKGGVLCLLLRLVFTCVVLLVRSNSKLN